MNMKNCRSGNVSKHREIKCSDKYVNLDIPLKFDSLDNMRIISSDTKDNLGRSGKGLITSLHIKSKARPKKYKKQGITSGISVRITLQRLLGSLTSYRLKYWC